MKGTLLVAVVAVVALAGSACAPSGEGAQREGSSGQMKGTLPGRAADPAEATREIVIKASDQLRFDPASIQLDVGEVVILVVRNIGKIDHELVLGDRAYQDMEEAAVEGGADRMEMDNTVTVAPGETKKLTWRFDDAGEVLYGCHVPGHYKGGMVGTITVA